jgi:hypothetical protein
MDNSNGDKTRSENIRRVQELTGEQAPLIAFSNIQSAAARPMRMQAAWWMAIGHDEPNCVAAR